MHHCEKTSNDPIRVVKYGRTIQLEWLFPLLGLESKHERKKKIKSSTQAPFALKLLTGNAAVLSSETYHALTSECEQIRIIFSSAQSLPTIWSWFLCLVCGQKMIGTIACHNRENTESQSWGGEERRSMQIRGILQAHSCNTKSWFGTTLEWRWCIQGY